METTLFQWISLILNILFGGGLFISLATLRSVKKTALSKAEKAAAEARADEIRNVGSAIKIWREIAEDMTLKYNEVSSQVQMLSNEVTKLTRASNKIARMLDKITHDNLEESVRDIKKELE